MYCHCFQWRQLLVCSYTFACALQQSRSSPPLLHIFYRKDCEAPVTRPLSRIVTKISLYIIQSFLMRRVQTGKHFRNKWKSFWTTDFILGPKRARSKSGRNCCLFRELETAQRKYWAQFGTAVSSRWNTATLLPLRLCNTIVVTKCIAYQNRGSVLPKSTPQSFGFLSRLGFVSVDTRPPRISASGLHKIQCECTECHWKMLQACVLCVNSVTELLRTISLSWDHRSIPISNTHSDPIFF